MALISQRYLELNAQMHKTCKEYGTSGYKNTDLVLSIIDDLKIKTVLDYGCGKQTLGKAIGHRVNVTGYDPALQLNSPVVSDLVTCTDVMEHVEAECVDFVIGHIFSFATIAVLFVISCEEGTRRLPDGSLAHCSVYPSEWWLDRIACFGTVEERAPVHPVKKEAVFLVRV